MLFQPPSAVCVMEPWDALRLPPDELFSSLRDELRAGHLQRGRLDIEALAMGQVRWCRDREKSTVVKTDSATRLGVKFPAFWRYLGLFPATKFLVCLRDPISVVHSFRDTGGRLASGLDYNVTFNHEMNRELQAATADPAVRRVLLYDYINSRIVPHLERPNVFTVRYERWFSEPDALLSEIGKFLDADLSSPLPVIRPPTGTGGPDDRDSELVRTHCRTAAILGYDKRSP
jgi:hypothetical protein